MTDLLYSNPILGTALWGWTVSYQKACQLADRFIEHGGRWFDTATNYPINGSSANFGTAIQWLAKWLQSRNITDANVIVKLGACHNDGSPDIDLSPYRLAKLIVEQQETFGCNLRIVSIHWDNRSNINQISDTVNEFRKALDSNLGIGLSGIQYPEVYAKIAPDLVQEWWVQVKCNPFDHAAYGRYSAFHGTGRFLAYGLNSGGYKRDGYYHSNNSATVRQIDFSPSRTAAINTFLDNPSDCEFFPQTFNQLSILSTTILEDVSGLILGPSSISQLEDSYSYLRSLSRARGNEILNRELKELQQNVKQKIIKINRSKLP